MCSLKRVRSQLTDTEMFKMDCQGRGEGDVCRAGLDCGSSFVAFQTAVLVDWATRDVEGLTAPQLGVQERRRGKDGERETRRGIL